MLRVNLRKGTRFARTSYVGPGRSDPLKIKTPGLEARDDFAGLMSWPFASLTVN